MKRRQLLELEDQDWFPSAIRDLATDLMRFMADLAGGRLVHHVAGRLGDALRHTGYDQVLDLCSGAGGPIPAIWRRLRAEGQCIRFTLTDKYPNRDALQRTKELSDGEISYVAEPVDAMSVPKHLGGFRTIFNTLHHFPPSEAQSIIRDAVDAGEPIACFELAERTPLGAAVALLAIPALVLIVTPFVRPFQGSRLFWTYLVPAVPLLVLFDGFASVLRAYTPEELALLVAELNAGEYHWEIGREALPLPYTYLIGWPRSGDERPSPGTTGQADSQ